MLAGYSEGAWVIDKALHTIASDGGPEARPLLEQIKGVYLMGDPARFPEDGGQGIATYFHDGYATTNEYYDDGDGKLLGDIQSTCLNDDPICQYDGNPLHFVLRLPQHWQYATMLISGKTPATWGGEVPGGTNSWAELTAPAATSAG